MMTTTITLRASYPATQQTRVATFAAEKVAMSDANIMYAWQHRYPYAGDAYCQFDLDDNIVLAQGQTLTAVITGNGAVLMKRGGEYVAVGR